MSGESNGSWGQLSEFDAELAEKWDSFDRLPNEGENPDLDALCEAKGITIGSLLRLGARITGDHLCFAYPGGIKYRNIVDGRRSSYLGSTWTQLKIVPAQDNPESPTVIVVEGETDGARLTLLYPESDIAVMPAGARSWRDEYTAQLGRYAAVLVGLDNDEPDQNGERAGDLGTAKILGAVPHAIEFRPPGQDWCSSDAEACPPIPESFDLPTVVGGVRFEPLDALLDGPIPVPNTLFEDVLYEEGVHWVSGHPGSGKTTFVMHVADVVMEHEGRHVVWFDYEGGVRPTLRRLLACGANPDVVRERFHYAGWPMDAEQALDAIGNEWPGVLVVIDSASKALAFAGKDENSPGEVTEWVAPVVRACKVHRLPVMVIDHVTKDDKGGQYARGAGSKLADSDVHWSVRKEVNFNRDEKGVLRLVQQKDREGCLPFESWWQIGDGMGNLPLLPLEGPPIEADDTDDGPEPVI